MENKEFDGKLFAILLLNKWKQILIATIAVSLIIGVPYLLSKTVIGFFDYRSEVTVHVEYGEDSAGNMYDYINFYTWEQYIKSDKFIDTLNVSESKDELKGLLDAEVPADQRVVVFTITSKDKALSDTLAGEVSKHIVDIILTIPEIRSAEVINVSPAVKYFVYNSTPQVFVLGLIIGFVGSILYLWIWFLLDDSVYIPRKFEEETGIKLTDERSESELLIDKDLPDLTDLKQNALLVIKAGKRNGKAVEAVIHECKKRGINIAGARIEDVNEKLVSAYYKTTKLKNLFM